MRSKIENLLTNPYISSRYLSSLKGNIGNNAIKTVLIILILIPVFGIIVPIIEMIVCSFFQYWTSAGVSGLTLKWYEEIFNYPGFLDSVYFSMKIAGLTVVVVNIIGLPFAYASCRYRLLGSIFIDELLRLPMLIPGPVFAIGLIVTFPMMYGSWYIIFIAHVVFTLTFYIESVINALSAFDFMTLENAARTLGASRIRSFSVILPLLKNAILVGSATVFTISWSEFNITLLLSSAKAQSFPSLLYSAYNGPGYQFSAAASVVFIIILIPFLFGLSWLSSHKKQ